MNELIVSRGKKEFPLDTIHYEIEMLRFSYRWIANNWNRCKETRERNCYLECFLLHFRNLTCFLASRGNQMHLQFAKGPQWAGREITAEEKRKIEKPARQIYDSEYDKISVYLAHCTRERHTNDIDWPVSKMMRGIEVPVREFLRIFPSERCPHDFAVLLEDKAYGTHTVTVRARLDSVELLPPAGREGGSKKDH